MRVRWVRLDQRYLPVHAGPAGGPLSVRTGVERAFRGPLGSVFSAWVSVMLMVVGLAGLGVPDGSGQGEGAPRCARGQFRGRELLPRGRGGGMISQEGVRRLASRLRLRFFCWGMVMLWCAKMAAVGSLLRASG